MSDFAEGDMKGLHSEDADSRVQPRENSSYRNGTKPSRTDPSEIPSNQGTSGDEITCHAAELVTKLLREEQDQARSNKLKKDILSRDNHFLFNRHTITLDYENAEVDFRLAAREHLKTESTQRWVSAQIEIAKFRFAGKQPPAPDASNVSVTDSKQLDTKTKDAAKCNTYSCTCGHTSDQDKMCIQCYNSANFDFGFLTPYTFQSTIKPYKQQEMSSLPEVDN